MFGAASRLVHPVARALYRTGSSNITCGPTPLSRSRVARAAFQAYNTQLRSLNSESKTEKGALPSRDLLEKQIATLSSDIHQKNRIFKNDLTRVINNVKENNFSTRWQSLLMLKCCSEFLPDQSSSSRLALVEEVWNALKPHTVFTTEHYNELLRCYIANGKPLNAASFLSQMSPTKPNDTTYELILEALCETGDLNQATEVISNMKAQGIPATEKTFNSLIIGQGHTGTVKNIEEVLTMMKTLKVDISKQTHVAIAKAHLLSKDIPGALNQLQTAKQAGFLFEEAQIMELVKCAALQGLTAVIPKILTYLPEMTLSTPSISPYMQSVVTQLVYLNCPLAALEIYKCLPLPAFGPSDDRGLHGRSLVRDCVKASMPINVIAAITQELMSSGRNPLALQSACEAALQQGRIPLALDILVRMKNINLPLRPHYFWPILVTNAKSYGEKGLLNTLSSMVQMEVRPDYDTILEYVLPHVSFSSPQNLMRKLLDSGLVVSDALTPMMNILLSSGQIRAASELCELFEGKIDSSQLIGPLIKGYLISEDVQSTLYVLEEMTKKSTQKNSDWVGRFMCKLAMNKNVRHDKFAFGALVKALKESSLKISSSALDLCTSQLSAQLANKSGEVLEELKTELDSITDDGLVDESEMFLQHIPHPRMMSEPALRSHLTELEAKGMNTRGVLRKLLQQYCREGKLKEAQEILDKCEREEVYLSAGMRASIFDLYVKLGELEQAEQTLADLTKSFPNFTIDDFKLIDFATLMVYRNKINKAFDMIDMLTQKKRSVNTKNMDQNCWRLLDAISANGTAKQTQLMFNLLSQGRLCKPTNVVLGPLVRVHLRTNDISKAVSEFARLANAHRCTPLKHELLCRALTSAGPEVDPQSNQLVNVVLQADKNVHGATSAQLSLIAVQAELGHKKNLRRLFLDPKSRVDSAALLKQCQRFADEKKVAPIEVIAECARDVRHIDVDALYDIMLQVYQRSDDYQGALSLWYKMAENVRPHPKFAHNLASLLHANHRQIPPEVLSLLDEKTRRQMV